MIPHNHEFEAVLSPIPLLGVLPGMACEAEQEILPGTVADRICTPALNSEYETPLFRFCWFLVLAAA